MLLYFIKNREHWPLLSFGWFKAWAKRLLSFPSLLGALWRLERLRKKGATIGNGVFIAPSVITGQLQGFSVGEQTFIGRVKIQVLQPVRLGSYVCLNDEVTILAASHDVRSKSWDTVSAPIVIDDYAWIATGATILPGVTIGRGAVVAARAVVAKDVPPYAVAYGNPAIIKDNVRPNELNYNPVSFIAAYRAWLGPRKDKYICPVAASVTHVPMQK